MKNNQMLRKLYITIKATAFIAACIPFWACGQGSNKKIIMEEMSVNEEFLITCNTAVFAGGCFWCTEAIFQDLKGVYKVESGYANGHIKNPSYKEVCSGRTGHAEVIKIWYKAEEISYEKLLEIHFYTHNPTTLNRQGNDIGTQYRSGIYFLNDEEKITAEKVKQNVASWYTDSIVTEIMPLALYYTAENYHQNYFNNNGNEPYCSFVISPKVEKFRKEYKTLLKP